MKLENYIADLLYRYDCVIVPNFGGFVANPKSAKQINTIFTPPFKQISFNSLLVENDGLLANYIASTDKMPYKTAVNFIAFEVQEWIDKLLSEELELEGIGTLHNINDTIQFEPCNKVNYLTSSFGLDAVVANKIALQKEEILQNNANLQIVDNVTDTTVLPLKNKTKNSNNLLKYAAIFLLGAATIGISVKAYQDRKTDAINLANSKKTQKNKTAKIQEATFVINSPLPTINIQTKTAPENYFIIAGAFREKSNAKKKIAELKAKGYDAKIIGKNKYDLTQVAFAGFSDLDEANKALQNIKNTELKEAWLLTR